jgi:hypothetical protein
MLFRKKMERSCEYCQYGAKLDDGMVLCAKKGVKTVEDKCRKFQYDPCKRTPAKAKPLDFSKYEEMDFSL